MKDSVYKGNKDFCRIREIVFIHRKNDVKE